MILQMIIIPNLKILLFYLYYSDVSLPVRVVRFHEVDLLVFGFTCLYCSW